VGVAPPAAQGNNIVARKERVKKDEEHYVNQATSPLLHAGTKLEAETNF
jgi:hypothetical protein